MAQTDLVGQCPTKINNIFVAEIMDMSVNYSVPTKVMKGAAGPIGVSQGIQDVTADFTLAIPKATGPTVDLVALSAAPGGFTYSYELGVKRYALVGCKVNKESLKVVNGEGSVTISGSLTATERIQTA